MRIALAVASLLLVAGGATACGDDSGGGSASDKGVSKDDFCSAFKGFYSDLQDIDGTEKNLGELLKKAAKKIEDAGTPDDIPSDAKAGLKLTLDAIDKLPDDATADDMTNLESDFTDAQQKQVSAFGDYLDKTCPDVTGSDSSTDSGSGSSDPSAPSAPTASAS